MGLNRAFEVISFHWFIVDLGIDPTYDCNQ